MNKIDFNYNWLIDSAKKKILIHLISTNYN